MAGQVPWVPRSLHEYVHDPGELREQWCYVILEEIVDGVALLMRWPWPLADEKGRLFWPREDDDQVREASIPVTALRRQLYQPGHVQRAPRVGDTFAVRRTDRPGWAAKDTVTDVAELFPDHVIDVSADARVAAKLAFQGSLVPVVPREAVDPDLVHKAGAERRQLKARHLVPDGAR